MNIFKIKILTLYVSLFALIFFSACSRAELKIDLDIYKDDIADTRFPITSETLTNYEQAVLKAREQGENLKNQKLDLANQLFDTYREIYITSTILKNKDYKFKASEIKGFEDYLKDYESKINSQYDQLKLSCQQTSAIITSYLDGKNKVPTFVSKDSEIIESLSRVSNNLRRLANESGTIFEETLMKNWGVVVAGFQDTNLKKIDINSFAALQPSQKGQIKKLRKASKDLDKKIQSIKDSGRKLPGIKIEQDTVTDKMPLIYKEEIPAKFVLNKNELETLSDLENWKIVLNDVLKLQDYGNPVWKVVTSDENKNKWNPGFNGAKFTADANTSVIIVRENPVVFRVQRAKNDPTAMIKGQLNIARALGDAAIQMAKAASGIPIPSTPNSPQAVSGAPSPRKSEETASKDEIEKSLFVREAIVSEKFKLRFLKLKSFKSNLAKIKAGLIVETDAAKQKKLIDQLNKVLDSHKSIFKPEK